MKKKRGENDYFYLFNNAFDFVEKKYVYNNTFFF